MGTVWGRGGTPILQGNRGGTPLLPGKSRRDASPTGKSWRDASPTGKSWRDASPTGEIAAGRLSYWKIAAGRFSYWKIAAGRFSYLPPASAFRFTSFANIACLNAMLSANSSSALKSFSPGSPLQRTGFSNLHFQVWNQAGYGFNCLAVPSVRADNGGESQLGFQQVCQVGGIENLRMRPHMNGGSASMTMVAASTRLMASLPMSVTARLKRWTFTPRFVRALTR